MLLDMLHLMVNYFSIGIKTKLLINFNLSYFILACSRDVNVNLKIFLTNLNEETKPNEFIPCDTISTFVPCYSVKNLCVLTKCNTEKNWSFEPDSTQPEAAIEYDFDIELLEFKSMNSNYYGYGQGQNQNRLYFNNQDPSYARVNSGSVGNRYTGVSNGNFNFLVYIFFFIYLYTYLFICLFF
jgi:hypothetical protein